MVYRKNYYYKYSGFFGISFSVCHNLLMRDKTMSSNTETTVTVENTVAVLPVLDNADTFISHIKQLHKDGGNFMTLFREEKSQTLKDGVESKIREAFSLLGENPNLTNYAYVSIVKEFITKGKSGHIDVSSQGYAGKGHKDVWLKTLNEGNSTGSAESKKEKGTKEYKGSLPYYSAQIGPIVEDEFLLFCRNSISDKLITYRESFQDTGRIEFAEGDFLAELFAQWSESLPERREELDKRLHIFREKQKDEIKYVSFLAEKVPFPAKIEGIGDKGCRLIIDKDCFVSFVQSAFVNLGFSWVGSPQQSDFIVVVDDMDIIPVTTKPVKQKA